jgi:hypothetical protein
VFELPSKIIKYSIVDRGMAGKGEGFLQLYATGDILRKDHIQEEVDYFDYTRLLGTIR